MAVYKTKDGYVMKGTIKRGPNDYYNYTKKLKGVTTKKEAQKIELDFKDKFNFEQKQKVSSVTFKELTELYDDKVKNNIKATTKQTNAYMLMKFVDLYNLKASSITSVDIQKILNTFIKRGASTNYVNGIYSYLNKIFKFGVKENYILYNPMTKIDRYKKPDEIKKEMKFYTPEQFKQLMLTAPKDKVHHEYECYVIINVLYFTGMRVGELSALTLQDVDLKKKTIHINKTLSFGIGDNRWHIGPAKSSRSERTIMIPTNLYEILVEYISYYKKIYGVTNQTFLFGVDVPIARETIRHRFWDMADLAGLERIRLHDLRHSHASLLANMGCSVTAIARRMGHSEAECFKTYIHLFVSTDVDLVNKIDKVF